MFVNEADIVVNDGNYTQYGQGYGDVGQGISNVKWENGLRRPFWVYRDGRKIPCATIATGRQVMNRNVNPETGKIFGYVPEVKTYTRNDLEQMGMYSPVFNATTLRKEEWTQLDLQVLRAARRRLRAWADLAAINSYGGFNGMAKLILEHEVMSDPGFAVVDMNGVSEGTGDQPLFQLRGLPLPIIHADFQIDQRKLAVSRNSGTPLDTTLGEAAGRRVAEAIEKLTIGVQVGPTYGGASTYVGGYDITSAVFGYVNYPNRLTATGLYKPTGNGRSGTGWVAGDTLKDVLAQKQTLKYNKFYGPFMLYTSDDWDNYMDGDYILTSTTQVTTQTLRERLRAIEGISDVRSLDFLFSSLTDRSHGGPGLENVYTAYPFTLLFVQMTPDVCRAVNGMDITTVQWEEKGGSLLKFKVMCIQVPQLRSDFYNNSGILQATCTL